MINTKSILSFMQREDKNGSWLEWLSEIESGDSTFDVSYVIETLQEWYDNTNEEKYLQVIAQLK